MGPISEALGLREASTQILFQFTTKVSRAVTALNNWSSRHSPTGPTWTCQIGGLLIFLLDAIW